MLSPLLWNSLDLHDDIIKVAVHCITNSGLISQDNNDRKLNFITSRPFWGPWGIKALSLHCLCPSSLTLNKRLDRQNLLLRHCVIWVYLIDGVCHRRFFCFRNFGVTLEYSINFFSWSQATPPKKKEHISKLFFNLHGTLVLK